MSCGEVGKKRQKPKEKCDVSHVTTGNGKYNTFIPTRTVQYSTTSRAPFSPFFTIPLVELGVMTGSILFHQQVFTTHRGFPLIHWPSFLLLAM